MADIIEAAIVGVRVVTPSVHGDARGKFVETYRREWFPDAREMVQGNRSWKAAGAVVGLHYHFKQCDYWSVAKGRALVVLHDLREGSPSDGKTVTIEIGDGDDRGVFIPIGVAHGFAALTDLTITYLVDRYYDPDDEMGVAWDDPQIGADWGVKEPILSRRDLANPRRSDLLPGRRPRYER